MLTRSYPELVASIGKTSSLEYLCRATVVNLLHANIGEKYFYCFNLLTYIKNELGIIFNSYSPYFADDIITICSNSDNKGDAVRNLRKFFTTGNCPVRSSYDRENRLWTRI